MSIVTSRNSIKNLKYIKREQKTSLPFLLQISVYQIISIPFIENVLSFFVNAIIEGKQMNIDHLK